MKNRLVFFLLLGGILAASCSPLDEPPSSGDRRRPVNGVARIDPATPEPPSPSLQPPEPDTVLYCTAVRFPDGYDWPRDSAYGTVPFELILYRDGDPVLTLAWDAEACFGPDPDRHHLLGGHLYTERLSGGQTRIGCDGKELFCFEDREFLVGLLPDGADLYTLSRNTSGAGFRYRKNGALLMESDSGIPFGDLSDPSYSPTGALYRDGDTPAFCYRQGARVFQVLGERQSVVAGQLADGAVLDCKVDGGRASLLRPSYQTYRLREGRLWFPPDGTVITGYFLTTRARGFSGWKDALPNSFPRQLCREEALIYYSPEGTYAITADDAGRVRWHGADGSDTAEFPARFFSPKCATVFGGQLVLALTPLDASQPPRLIWGTQQMEFNLNGYISAVAVEISLPN